MDTLTALVPYAAYAGVIGALVILVNRVFDADEPGLDGLFQIQLGPPSPRDIQEEEPVRWDVERLRRPTRDDASPAAASAPAGVCGAPSAS